MTNNEFIKHRSSTVEKVLAENLDSFNEGLAIVKTEDNEILILDFYDSGVVHQLYTIDEVLNLISKAIKEA